MANNYLIIGAGAAGVSAAEAIRSQDPLGEITQVCDESAGYYSRPGLAYYLTGEISEDCLYPYKTEDFQKLSVHTIKAQVKRILPSEKRVELHDGRFLSYSRLLIAVGARASGVQVPGIELEGVVKLDNLEDARRILKLAHKRRVAVVVGGGITALELVEAFRARGLSVHYFLRGDRYWSNVLDETESRIVEQRLADEGIQLHYQTELAEILGKHGKVWGVKTTTGEQIKCDVVGIAVGIQPRKAIAESAGIKTNRGILVDQYLNTSDPNIFAAGDVAEVYDPTLGKAILDSLWAPARRQGYTAGLNMTAMNVAYLKGVPFNVTRLAGLTTTIIGALGGRDEDADVVGIVRGDSEGWREMPDAIVAQANFSINRLRILVGENTLMGALLMGDQTLSHAMHEIVVNKIDITSIREKILKPDCPIPEIIGDFWSEVSLSKRREYATIQS
jgi:3-phenylpropionate/trans-cinnamate dioxygenase ferredoxin reductase component